MCSVLHCELGCVQCIRVVCAVVRCVIFNKFCFHNATCMHVYWTVYCCLKDYYCVEV